MEIGLAFPSPAVLEIGSRNVTGVWRSPLFPHCRSHVGFDIIDGPGVDMVGDAHHLSKYFEKNHFDFVYSMSLFEHLGFPWKVVIEMNKVMQTGGYLYISTHCAWPVHELPWDFWRYQAGAFQTMFNSFTGFEITMLAEGLPCRSYSLVDDMPTRALCFHTLNQGVAVICKKTGDYREDLLKWDVEMSDIIPTMYPDHGHLNCN
ncbi:MAG: class I SAM-dependent methyltransferase [Desulfamplus sp.]|nr:class I SAM-dependent methyltransferase [Desulfamplus sp.]